MVLFNTLQANKATYEFFQTQPGELSGKLCYELFTGGSEPCPECPLLVTLQDLGKHSIIIRHERMGKIFQVSSSAVLAENGEIQYLIHVAKDITEQRKQEQLARQMSRQQEQLQHFASLKTMAGAIAHRFNNAMMVVQGNLDLMLITLPDSSEQKAMASDALQAAKGASLVSSMMLSYVGQRPLHPQLSCLSDLATECATELKHQMGPSLALKFISPPAPLCCTMDKQQIKEVLTSILTNAIESLHNEADEIEISFGADHYEVDCFPVVFQDKDTITGMYIFCQIRDRGQGISAENLRRLFEPFFTTKFVGRGLGLALSVGIMRSHHGAVLVESEPGAGTTVRMLLPGVV
jgi:signal transduction histidine kinase